MIKYKATAPAAFLRDPKTNEPVQPFNGKTCGVQFGNNEAYFDDITVKASGKTAEQIATMLVKDFGYTVVTVDEKGEHAFVPAPRENRFPGTNGPDEFAPTKAVSTETMTAIKPRARKKAAA